MRIAIVSRDVDGIGGTVTTILEHAKRLSARGWNPVIVGERLDEAAVISAGAEPRTVRGLPFGSGLKRRWFAWRAESAVADCELVHGHGDSMRQDVLSLHNCVHTAHEAVHGAPLPAGGVGGIHEAQLRGRAFRHLIANSKLMRDDVVARFGVPAQMISVIYPGHDPVRFHLGGDAAERRDLRASLSFLETDVVFGLITSGDFEKRGVDVFIEALSHAAPRLRGSLRALIMGKEKHLARYRRQVVDEELTEIVTFLPPSTKVERFYRALDAYVHPAHFEEFGQSVQEALACGLPVLTNKRVGASELMTGEAAEHLLEKTDAHALSGQICVLAGDAGLRGRLGALGPESVKKNTWDANFSATWDVYQKILNGRRDSSKE